MIIFRYLFKEVYGTLLLSTAVLVFLLTSNQFVHYLTQAAVGAVPMRTVIQMMSLQVPLLLPILLPLGLYLGILIAYGRLYADQEMTVLSACGFSRAQLLGLSLLFALGVSLVVAVLSLWVQPIVEEYKRQVVIAAATASPLERITAGQFIKVNNNTQLVFYAQALSRDHKSLEHIFVAQRDTRKPFDQTPWTIVQAASGQEVFDPKTGDKFVVLKDGYRYTGAPGQRDYQIAKFGSYGIRIQQNIIPSKDRVEAVPTVALWQQQHTNPTFAAELQWRIALPLSVLILTLIAIPLSKVKPRQGRFARLLPAFLFYIVYVNLLFTGRAWLEDGTVSPAVGLWWVHSVMLFIAALLLMRFFGRKQ